MFDLKDMAPANARFRVVTLDTFLVERRGTRAEKSHTLALCYSFLRFAKHDTSLWPTAVAVGKVPVHRREG